MSKGGRICAWRLRSKEYFMSIEVREEKNRKVLYGEDERRKDGLKRKGYSRNNVSKILYIIDILIIFLFYHHLKV